MISNDLRSVDVARHRGDKVTYHPAGRFLIKDGAIHHLEDYHGLLGDIFPEGDIDHRTAMRLHHWPDQSSYFRVRSIKDEQPKSPVQEKSPGQATKPSVFDYHRAGHDAPHLVEFREGKALLDGNPLSHEETAAIADNVRTGAATLRHRGTPMSKAEAVLERLQKADSMHPQEALRQIQEAVRAGHIHPDVEGAVRQHIYGDPMVEGLGNRFAYNEFKSTPRPGVHIAMDLNGFKGINDTHGHGAGDDAIKAAGRAIRESMDEAVGRDQGKAYRSGQTISTFRQGGDEFSAHVPTMEHAALFSRSLREKLDKIPLVGGTHKLAMSIGMGHDPNTADKALYFAKARKSRPGGELPAPHEMPHLAHSLVPGHEGPVPLSEAQMPAMPAEPKVE